MGGAKWTIGDFHWFRGARETIYEDALTGVFVFSKQLNQNKCVKLIRKCHVSRLVSFLKNFVENVGVERVFLDCWHFFEKLLLNGRLRVKVLQI